MSSVPVEPSIAVSGIAAVRVARRPVRVRSAKGGSYAAREQRRLRTVPASSEVGLVDKVRLVGPTVYSSDS